MKVLACCGTSSKLGAEGPVIDLNHEDASRPYTHRIDRMNTDEKHTHADGGGALERL